MPAVLLDPTEAARALASLVRKRWAEIVLADLDDDAARPPLTVTLRRGVRGPADYERHRFDRVHAWREAWAELPVGVGWLVERSAVGAGGPVDPVRLVAHDVAGAAAFVRAATSSSVQASDAVPSESGRALPDVDGARALAAMLRAGGAVLTPSSLRKAFALSRDDRAILVEVVRYLSRHPDLTGVMRTGLQIPEAHTKWLTGANQSLVQLLTGRGLDAELRPRPPVVHFTYLDPGYRATRARVHDSWTGGDVHAPAYVPSVVVIVENRDSRLTFPAFPGAIAVEGGGNAAEALLDQVPWIVGADVVAYWGDLDADGFAILARLRATFAAHGKELPSLLMDAVTLHEFGWLRATTDRRGRALGPRGGVLRGLTGDENAAYMQVATAGDAAVRRIEQEKLPPERAASALASLAERARATH